MKNLYIVRHAKSSWDNPFLNDTNRPLNERGKRDAPRMGKRLLEMNILPNFMISSPAIRAISTCHTMAEVLGVSSPQIKIERDLYHANPDGILRVVKHIENQHEHVMIFGHNPGLTDFVNALRVDRSIIENIPTCGVVGFSIEIDSWSDLTWRQGKLLFFDYPKARDD